MGTTDTIILDDSAWATTRDEITGRFLGVDAETFVARYLAGEYDGANEPDALMSVLAFFPELD